MTVTSTPPVTRRTALLAGLAGFALPAVPSAAHAAVPLPAAATRSTSHRLADPFTLGVASGDPEPDGVVLWTRLAPHPLAADGRGGMPARDVQVDWQVAIDPRFTRLVRHGAVRAHPRCAHSVHVEVSGLEPDREYFYRFRAEGHLSRVGRTRTAPVHGSSPTAFTVAVASCAEYEHGYFTAYRRLAQEDPDLVLHLGDYMYEFGRDEYVARPHNVRAFDGPETVTLAD